MLMVQQNYFQIYVYFRHFIFKYFSKTALSLYSQQLANAK